MFDDFVEEMREEARRELGSFRDWGCPPDEEEERTLLEVEQLLNEQTVELLQEIREAMRTIHAGR